MYVATLGNKAIFAKCVIYVLGEYKPTLFSPIYNIKNNEIVCFFDHERDNAIAELEKHGVKYSVENLTVDKGIKEKVKGIAYKTPDEVRAHLLENAEPESQIIPNLKKRLQEAEAKSALIPDLIARLEDTERELKAVKGISMK